MKYAIRIANYSTDTDRMFALAKSHKYVSELLVMARQISGSNEWAFVEKWSPEFEGVNISYFDFPAGNLF